MHSHKLYVHRSHTFENKVAKLLGTAKALQLLVTMVLQEWGNSETIAKMTYAEIKAYYTIIIGAKCY